MSFDRKTNWISLFLISLLIFSCKRTGIVNGKVVSVIDGSPIEGVETQIHYSNGKFFNNKSGVLPSMVSDINGEFSTEVDFKKKKFEFSINMIVPEESGYVQDTSSALVKHCFLLSTDYRAMNSDQEVQKINQTSKQEIEFKVAPTARLKIVALDSPPNELGSLVVMVDDENMGNTAFYWDTFGPIYDEFEYKYVVPINNVVKIKWGMNVNGTVTQYNSVSIPLEPYKKVVYKLIY